MRELDPVALEAACKAHAPMWEGIDPTIQKYAREQMAAAIQAYLQLASAELQGGDKQQVGGNPSHLSVGVRVKPQVYVKEMKRGGPRPDGSTSDFFVAIRVDDREVTPHCFRQRYKAEYHVALYDWLLNGGEEPDLMAFDEEDWPARHEVLDSVGICSALGFDPTNHHNAAKCPYCNPPAALADGGQP